MSVVRYCLGGLLSLQMTTSLAGGPVIRFEPLLADTPNAIQRLPCTVYTKETKPSAMLHVTLAASSSLAEKSVGEGVGCGTGVRVGVGVGEGVGVGVALGGTTISTARAVYPPVWKPNVLLGP